MKRSRSPIEESSADLGFKKSKSDQITNESYYIIRKAKSASKNSSSDNKLFDKKDQSFRERKDVRELDHKSMHKSSSSLLDKKDRYQPFYLRDRQETFKSKSTSSLNDSPVRFGHSSFNLKASSKSDLCKFIFSNDHN